VKLNQNAPAAPDAMPRPMPDYVDAELDKLRSMQTGAGINNQLFQVARRMAPYRTDQEICDTLKAATANCGRDVPERELFNAVNSARKQMRGPSTGGTMAAPIATPAPQRWPEVDVGLRESILKGTPAGFEVADLWDASPVMLESGSTEHVIDTLFPGNPLLCVGKSKSMFATRTRNQWRGTLSQMQFIVPSPMSKVTGLTQAKTPSQHCLDNTGPRRFAVIESDCGTEDEQAAILWHLRYQKGFPLAMVVHSGGESLHGWFYVQGQSEQRVNIFNRYCRMLGADRATFTRFQFVRMPDGVRQKDDGTTAPQHIIYFDPSVIPAEVQP